jgi:predicted esterase
MTRRQFAARATGALAAGAVSHACGSLSDRTSTPGSTLTARPGPGSSTIAAGTTKLDVGAGREVILHVPPSAAAPLALVVMLHGAGGRAAEFLTRFASAADAAGIAVVVPDSHASTWDAIHGRFGRDVELLDRVLTRVFADAAVDPARVAIGGFSDGASYALSLGLANGDLFRRILAFSPGFVVGGPWTGRPACFISHGLADRILPIDRCGRRIARDLQRRGYPVEYEEFAGGHEMPPAMLKRAFESM